MNGGALYAIIGECFALSMAGALRAIVGRESNAVHSDSNDHFSSHGRSLENWPGTWLSTRCSSRTGDAADGLSLREKTTQPLTFSVSPCEDFSLRISYFFANIFRRIASRGDSLTTHAIILTDSVSLLATKSEKWNEKPRLERVDGRHPPSKTPVGVMPE